MSYVKKDILTLILFPINTPLTLNADSIIQWIALKGAI